MSVTFSSAGGPATSGAHPPAAVVQFPRSGVWYDARALGCAAVLCCAVLHCAVLLLSPRSLPTKVLIAAQASARLEWTPIGACHSTGGSLVETVSLRQKRSTGAAHPERIRFSVSLHWS